MLNQTNTMIQEPIVTERIAIGRKVFFLDLKENQRGRFVKITEDVQGHRDTIMMPAEGLRAFVSALGRILNCEENLGEPAFANYGDNRS